MNAPHLHADILRALADGKKIECRIQQHVYTGDWRKGNLQDVCNNPGDLEFRIAPETVLINGVECPKPGHQNGNHSRIRLSIENCMEPEARSYYYANGTDARTVFDALCKPFKEGV